MTRVVLSAYNAAPADLSSNADAESSWYDSLRRDVRVSGLELPLGPTGLHPAGTGRLAELLHPGWSNTVTAMSATLAAGADDPVYGLASVDRGGRSRALAHIALARSEIQSLRRLRGRDAVTAIALQSAPRADRSSASAFRDSLETVASWEWDGVELLVEHCDALVPGRTPCKGYLGLADERDAVAAVQDGPTRVRHLLNWARSAIEGRDPATARSHIAEVESRLGGFTFSGAASDPAARGGAWADVHLGLAGHDPGSLLTPDEVAATSAVLPASADFIGVKVGAPLGSEGLGRLAPARRLLAALPECVAA